jgi:hypothetical protein
MDIATAVDDFEKVWPSALEVILFISSLSLTF